MANSPIAVRSQTATTNFPSLGYGPRNDVRGPVQGFEDVLKSFTRTSVMHTPPRNFILVTRLLAWFRGQYQPSPARTNAGRLLMDVWEFNEPPNLVKNLLDEMQPGDRCWLKVFTILLKLKRPILIEDFWNLRLLDRKLPITEDELFRKTSNLGIWTSEDEARDFVKKFFHFQYELCIEDSLDGRTLDVMTILPVCQKVPIKPDGNLKIFQIGVPRDCISSNILERVRSEPYTSGDHQGELYHEFALKVLKDMSAYKQESFAYSALRGREGIVQCLGDWELKLPNGESEYHLLLEYGEYDLDEYFQIFPPPSIPRDIIRFWKDLTNVAIALNRIHHMTYTVEGRVKAYYGWHGDIKPENLLFCDGEWKIADPGFARIESEESAQFDINNLPVILLDGGTKSYGPPEQFAEKKEAVTQRFDIWSLGCVMSEAATWLLLGNRGVDQFRLVRKSAEFNNQNIDLEQPEPRGDDCFHNGVAVAQSVLAWHNYLRQSLRQNDHVTGRILSLIEKQMLLQHANKRIPSARLVHQLTSILDDPEIDRSLGLYKPPSYFRLAIEAEQRKNREEWSNPLGNLPPRKSNRYRSAKFQSSTTVNRSRLDESTADRRSVYTPLLSTTVPDILPRVQRSRADTAFVLPKRDGGDTLNIDSFAKPKRLESSVGDRPRPFPRDSEEIGRFDYWDALHYLENENWIYTGSLERRQDRAYLMTPPPSTASSTATSQHRPTPVGPHTLDVATDEQNLPPSSKSVESKKGKSKQRVLITHRGAFRTQPPVKPVPNYNFRDSHLIHNIFKGHKKTESSGSLQSRGQKEPELIVPRENTPVQVQETIPAVYSADNSLKNEFLNDHFETRDVVFLVDNGSSMGVHWSRVRELIGVLVAMLNAQDDNGMEIYFTSCAKPFGPLHEPKQFVDIVNKMRPKDPPDNSERNEAVWAEAARANDIRKVLMEILHMIGNTVYQRKVTLIILTDGIWSGIGAKRTVADRIVNFLEQWQDERSLKGKLKSRGVSIQFIQFGDDEDAKNELKYLDDELENSEGHRLPDIIDLEPATGNVYKMILGSLSGMWDEIGSPTQPSDDIYSKGEHAEWHGLGTESIISHSPMNIHELHSPEAVTYGSNPIQTYDGAEIETGYSGAQFGDQARTHGRRSSNVTQSHAGLSHTQGHSSRHHHRRGTRDSSNAGQHGGQWYRE